MAAKGKKRQRALLKKKQLKAQRFKDSEGAKHRSKYARKKAYLFQTGKWGFELEGKKPW